MTTVMASPAQGSEQVLVQYSDVKVIGNGSFGVVYLAKLTSTGELVAIKKVLQDRRFKNRELQIMRELDHKNIVQLKFFFHSGGENKDEVYLNLILEYVPDTVYRVERHYARLRQTLPIIYVKLYMFQLLRALSYIHGIGICHRDIKPQNLLIDPETAVLKLCDFGSAKYLVKGEPNVSYICSRYYRAPELIFGATDYKNSIDTWSVGTVLAELLLGRPIFCGDSGVDQLVEIIKILGTPTKEHVLQMNSHYKEHKFPLIKGIPWSLVFRPGTNPEAIELVSQLLLYPPDERLDPLDACVHPFFDEILKPCCKLPNGRPIPVCTDFTLQELGSKTNLAASLCTAKLVGASRTSETAQGSAVAMEASIASTNEKLPDAATDPAEQWFTTEVYRQ